MNTQASSASTAVAARPDQAGHDLGGQARQGGEYLLFEDALGLALVPLFLGFTDAQDGCHAVAQDRPQRGGHRGVVHAEERAPFRVPDDDVGRAQSGQEARADLARACPGILVRAVLRTQRQWDVLLLHQRLHGAQVGEGGMDRHVQPRHVVGLQAQAEVSHGVQRLNVVVVHLPVPADQRAPCAH
jgi:hypothetical protein